MPLARVLCVDDEPGACKLVAHTLSRLDCAVETVASAADGLALFARNPFEVVICDVGLPDMDGIEMIRRMEADDPTVVTLVITCRQDQQTAVRALEAGAVGFLAKPFTAESLRMKVEHAIRKRKRRVETRLLMGELIESRSSLHLKVAEQGRMLTQTERYLNQLIDAAPFGIVSTDRQDRILTFNGVAERIYGYAHREVAGQPVQMLFKDACPSGPAGKAHHVRKDGSVFPAAVRTREILDEQRQEIARLFVVQDLSEQEHIEEQLQYAERLSLVGQLAPRIAHEFKTPLQIVFGHAELALSLMNAGSSEKARKAVERIFPAKAQLLDLVQKMSDLGKPQENRVEALDLRSELERVLESLGPLGVVKYCHIVRDFDDELPKVQGDATQIEQIFRNLIVNAAQVMESLSKRELVLRLRGISGGQQVEAVVEDSGPGIPEENLERIFYPFFTTKPEGKGTGLGLAIVKTMMERHGGAVYAENRREGGVRFVLSFPALAGAEQAPVSTLEEVYRS